MATSTSSKAPRPHLEVWTSASFVSLVTLKPRRSKFMMRTLSHPAGTMNMFFFTLQADISIHAAACCKKCELLPQGRPLQSLGPRQRFAAATPNRSPADMPELWQFMVFSCAGSELTGWQKMMPRHIWLGFQKDAIEEAARWADYARRGTDLEEFANRPFLRLCRVAETDAT